MKKIILFFLILVVMGFAYAGEYSTVTVGGTDFEIPSEYSGGEYKNGEYVYKDLRTFAVLCVDDYLVSNFGGYASVSDSAEEITIGDRPAMLLTTYNRYISANVLYLYFPVNQSVYCICFRSDNLTPEISHTVESAPKSNISSDTFYGLLDEAYDKYKERQFMDAVNDDSYSYVSQQDNHEDRNEFFIQWFLLTHYR